MHKKISIIVAVYNTADYLEECLNSVVNQTIDSKEIIIINDGSIDNSHLIINKYSKQYPDMIVINKPNEGTFLSRFDGMQCAQGEYIGFVDSDDKLEPDMYEKLIRCAEETRADIVETGYNFFCDENKDIYEATKDWRHQQIGKVIGMHESADVLESFLKYKVYPQLWKRIYRKDVVKKVVSDVKQIQNYRKYFCGIRNEDEFLFPHLLIHAESYYGMKEKLYHYRFMSRQSISRESSTGINNKFNKILVLIKADAYIRSMAGKHQLLKKHKKLDCALRENEYTDMIWLYDFCDQSHKFLTRFKEYHRWYKKETILNIIWKYAKEDGSQISKKTIKLFLVCVVI